MGQRAPLNDDLDDLEPFDVIVCQGWPRCTLGDEAAVQNQKDGCPLCRRYRQNLDGTETEFQLKAQHLAHVRRDQTDLRYPYHLPQSAPANPAPTAFPAPSSG